MANSIACKQGAVLIKPYNTDQLTNGRWGPEPRWALFSEVEIANNKTNSVKGTRYTEKNMSTTFTLSLSQRVFI